MHRQWMKESIKRYYYKFDGFNEIASALQFYKANYFYNLKIVCVVAVANGSA